MRANLCSTISLFAVVFGLFATPALAADLKLPAPSPLARVMQTVGVTECTVEYSSPGVKGRKIFGGLLKYGELWRTGANGATKVTFSTDVMVGGKAVPAGTYALFTIPGKRDWTVILNKNADQGGTRKYDEKLDQVRVKIAAKRAPVRERLTFLFTNAADNSVTLDLEWEKVRVSVPVTIDTRKLAAENITAAHRAAWRELASSARYMHGVKDYAAALKLVDASLALEMDFYNAFIKARILHAKGDEKAAQTWAQKAQKLGETAKFFFWKDAVAEALKGKW